MFAWLRAALSGPSAPAVCAECLTRFTERARRRPCPTCGSLARIVIRTAADGIGLIDRAR